MSEQRPGRILPKAEVRRRAGYISNTTLWRMERRGDFPKSVQLSPGRVGWREADVERWLAERPITLHRNG